MSRMLGRFLVSILSVTGLLLAQHGGGGGHHGGGFSGGGGHAAAAPQAFHSSNVSGFNMNVNPGGIRGNSDGFNINIHTGNTGAPLGYLPAARPRPPINGPRPVYGSGELRRPIGYNYGRVGFGWYPYFPIGYYSDWYDTTSYQPEPQQSYEPYPYVDQPQQEPVYQYPPVPYQQDPQPQVSAPEPVQPSPPLTLILKNGQKLQVQNYAIMNGLFWDFSKPTPKKIALSDIDVAASAKATDEAGAAFPEESFAANPS